MDLAATDAPHVLVVTGMSGAGRSSAAKILEDLGYTVIDNLPPQLLSLAVQAHDIPQDHKHLAVVIDSRGGLPTEELRYAMQELEREGVLTRIVFLDADDDVIVTRYEENRRPHPLGLATISEAIDAERALLGELKEMADVVIDTSNLNVHELRERLTTQFSEDDLNRPMRVSIRSFGFKNGTPRDTDLLFDVRFLPNPHWVPELRELRGIDASVSDYVLGADGAEEFVDRVEGLLRFLIPKFLSEGKSYLSIGIGCTGGHHRSVAIAEELASRLAAHGVNAAVRHRDVER
ncbi:MAG TPA: RNase adapter RapZ [Acidimicrobiia bacterium]|nr:RNase adapter RapZ [Acidimicrobiia bacterium]